EFYNEALEQKRNLEEKYNNLCEMLISKENELMSNKNLNEIIEEQNLKIQELEKNIVDLGGYYEDLKNNLNHDYNRGILNHLGNERGGGEESFYNNNNNVELLKQVQNNQSKNSMIINNDSQIAYEGNFDSGKKEIFPTITLPPLINN